MEAEKLHLLAVLHWMAEPSPGVDPLKVFERLRYFVADKDSTPRKLIFNRTVTLRDSSTHGSSSTHKDDCCGCRWQGVNVQGTSELAHLRASIPHLRSFRGRFKTKNRSVSIPIPVNSIEFNSGVPNHSFFAGPLRSGEISPAELRNNTKVKFINIKKQMMSPDGSSIADNWAERS
ncbi:Aminoacyl-tRNA synthetase, class I, conserved site-containing protein [Artemisia annua]|uniref:Aminoacyl-tRNA synthetase, class I, conserved site-containing protein n=1 Tax=Artemisia annua TaxID=35608 RepID=A0A2U1PV58_ARTAN|nr:Aminoacyl-tRNA synthetase, class I, conserved site-containing protein [Artemisia annua]